MIKFLPLRQDGRDPRSPTWLPKIFLLHIYVNHVKFEGNSFNGYPEIWKVFPSWQQQHARWQCKWTKNSKFSSYLGWLKKHKDARLFGQFTIFIPYWVILLMSSSDIFLSLFWHQSSLWYTDVGQYSLYAIPTSSMTCHCYPASFVDQNSISIKLSSQWSTLVINMPLMSGKMEVSLACMKYHLQARHAAASLQELCWPSATNLVLNKHGDEGQFCPCAILCEIIMPYYSYPASFVNQHTISSSGPNCVLNKQYM